jgi:hypothetical protein
MYHTEPYQNKCIIHRKLYIASWLGTGAPYASLGARYNEGRATRLGRGRVRPERLLAPGDGTGRRRGARQGRPNVVARQLRVPMVHRSRSGAGAPSPNGGGGGDVTMVVWQRE